MDASQTTWYLQKHHDETLFGPISFEQLKTWANDAQVSPLDRISNDGVTWVKAPMIPELEMDYLVEVTPDQYYGPTTFGAIREFVQMGEINPETEITNCRDGSKAPLRDIPELQPARGEEENFLSVPVRTSIRVNLQQRIRELEEALMEERRAREMAEHLIEKLEAKLAEVTRAAST
jgi:hypothetical protein